MCVCHHFFSSSHPCCLQTVTFADPLAGGAQRSVPAGRLECTMQVGERGRSRVLVNMWTLDGFCVL